MLAIAPEAEPPGQDEHSCHHASNEPVKLPIVSSGDPSFASRADEILRSTIAEPDASQPS
ncbi:hypothetical protein [Promicromonospora sukumoe]|uniref:hypothetical protein n=1 Tax=Promicromonospora sukumoe TaxID=88382 RepID=UPI0018DBDD03|nr:hypothetical protein [Promicromonospora sukumoe]